MVDMNREADLVSLDSREAFGMTDAEYTAMLQAELDASEFALGDEMFDPSGGYEADDFDTPNEDGDYDTRAMECADAEAEAWHSQYDYY